MDLIDFLVQLLAFLSCSTMICADTEPMHLNIYFYEASQNAKNNNIGKTKIFRQGNDLSFSHPEPKIFIEKNGYLRPRPIRSTRPINDYFNPNMRATPMMQTKPTRTTASPQPNLSRETEPYGYNFPKQENSYLAEISSSSKKSEKRSMPNQQSARPSKPQLQSVKNSMPESPPTIKHIPNQQSKRKLIPDIESETKHIPKSPHIKDYLRGRKPTTYKQLVWKPMSNISDLPPQRKNRPELLPEIKPLIKLPQTLQSENKIPAYTFKFESPRYKVPEYIPHPKLELPVKQMNTYDNEKRRESEKNPDTIYNLSEMPFGNKIPDYHSESKLEPSMKPKYTHGNFHIQIIKLGQDHSIMINDKGRGN